jgi:TPR repeat protein
MLKQKVKERVSLRNALENSSALARELEAMAGRTPQTQPRQTLARSAPLAPASDSWPSSARRQNSAGALAVSPPSDQANIFQKQGVWRNIAVLSFSGAIIGLTGYAFFSQEEPRAKFAARALVHAQEAPAPAAAAGEQIAGENIEAAPPAPQTIKSFSRATETALLERAFAQLTRGDVAGARMIFGVLAEHGSRDGAQGLAETYDPNYFAARLVKGLEPNVELARQWYRKALELGSQKAAQRLEALNKTAG